MDLLIDNMFVFIYFIFSIKFLKNVHHKFQLMQHLKSMGLSFVTRLIFIYVTEQIALYLVEVVKALSAELLISRC